MYNCPLWALACEGRMLHGFTSPPPTVQRHVYGVNCQWVDGCLCLTL